VYKLDGLDHGRQATWSSNDLHECDQQREKRMEISIPRVILPSSQKKHEHT
jgi:hypothetical protein